MRVISINMVLLAMFTKGMIMHHMSNIDPSDNCGNKDIFYFFTKIYFQ